MKKRSISLVLALLLALICCAPAAMAAPRSTWVELPANFSALNVRSGPGTDYSVAGWVVDGDEIGLLRIGNTWSRIRVYRSGCTGYIKNIYIASLCGDWEDKPSAPSTPSTSGTASAGQVSGNGVNMRKGPSSSYSKVTTLYSGTPLKLWDSSGNWYYASTLSGTSGWISKTYVNAGCTVKTTARVNLRESPNGALIRTLTTGTSLSVLSFTGNWAKVKAGSATGYVYAQYIK